MALALIVDDEVDLCRLMQMTLKRMDIDVRIAYDYATATAFLAEEVFDFCLTDLRLPDGSGLDLVKLISQQYPNTPVAVITAHGSMDLAIEALKLGAFDFVNKPLELPRLRQLVENALKAAADANEQTSPNATPDLFEGKLIGQSTAITELKNTIQKLARSQAPVFLWGESGTGKEVVARLIHELSPRSQASFVPVNCGAIPAELMESEFFGHKKGSFTGATADKDGLFQQANGGTLFLDEVADLPLAMQVKLLRAIQEKKVRPIGGTQEIAVDIRLLSATHKNLAKLVEAGEFRQDLYYRIHVIEVRLPSLNQRADDILLLAEHFLAQISADWQLDSQPMLTEGAKRALLNHRYLGNVRELRNILERAITLSDSEIIDVAHLQLTPMEIAASQESNKEASQEANKEAIQEASQNTTHHEPISQDSVNQATVSHAAPPQNLVSPTNANPPSHPHPSVATSSSQPHAIPTAATIAQPSTQTLERPERDTSPKTTISTSYQQTAFNPTVCLTPRGILTSNTQLVPNTASSMPSSTNLPPQVDDLSKINDPINTLPTASVRHPDNHSLPNQANTQVIGNPETTTLETTTSDTLPNDGLPSEGLEAYLLQQERQLIIAALNQSGGNKTQAAKLLNTTFRSLRYRMKKLGIDGDDD